CLAIRAEGHAARPARLGVREGTQLLAGAQVPEKNYFVRPRVPGSQKGGVRCEGTTDQARRCCRVGVGRRTQRMKHSSGDNVPAQEVETLAIARKADGIASIG